MSPSQARTGAQGSREHGRLRLVRGEATPEEVAAVLAVLSAVTGGEPRPAAGQPSPWASHERALRGPLTGGWRASGLPR